jgi:hypothetical protein
MTEPILIDPDALYDDGALCLSLGVTSSSVAAARRAGTLRYARQGKRTLYKGAWILAWLESEAAVVAAKARDAAHSQGVGQ